MKEGDLVLGTVESVTNTITFVRLLDGSLGTIISSEIAPGRIKHMREYVVPNKKIVCKVLEISNGHIHLSLRRVSQKEKKDFLEKWKSEQALDTAIKQLFGDQYDKIKNSILKDFNNLQEFMSSAKKDLSLIDKYFYGENAKKIKNIIEKKKKKQEIKHIVKLKTLDSDGIIKIKDILDINEPSLEITYISAGNYRLVLSVDDFKAGKKRMEEIISEIEKKAKNKNVEFYEQEEK